MTNLHLVILAAVAVAMVGITVFVYSGAEEAPSEFVAGAGLVQGLNPDAVHQLVLKSGEHTVTLVRAGSRFTVKEKDHYPAQIKKVNELFFDVEKLRLAARITDNPENHAELGVALSDGKKKDAKGEQKKEGGEEKEKDEWDDAMTVEFLDKDGKRIIGFITGKDAEGGGVYVRLLGEDVVYATESRLWLNSRPLDYVDRTLLKLDKKDLARVEVRVGKDEYVIRRKEEGKDELVLEPAPGEGKRMKKTAVDDVFGALPYFDMADVHKKDFAGVEWGGLYVAELRNQAKYLVRTGKKDGKHYVSIGTDVSAVPPVRIFENDDKEALKKKNDLVELQQHAAETAQRHAPWVYEVSTYDAEKLGKPHADLVEDDVPDEITARHILIAYKGAERADDKITRSKDEAKKLAEQVLAEVKKEGADFAALAKKHSDGPTGEKGGDLGSFKKGKMAAAFDAVAFKLKVDEISDITETPFGFHIIQRTK
jgi:hypothetical protein